MSPLKAAMYVVLGLLGLIVVSAVVSMIFAVIALLWLAAKLIAMLVVLGIVGYVGYKAYSLVTGLFGSGSEESGFRSDVSTQESGFSTRRRSEAADRRDPVERLKDQYARGDLTEAEFERRVERRLDDGGVESIETDLNREYR
jgi:hypothetical protein